MYQIVVGNGEETVTANFNEVFPGWNLNSETKSKYSPMQLIKGQMNQNLDIFFQPFYSDEMLKIYVKGNLCRVISFLAFKRSKRIKSTRWLHGNVSKMTAHFNRRNGTEIAL